MDGLSSKVKHSLAVVSLVGGTLTFSLWNIWLNKKTIDPWERYGHVLTICLITLRYVPPLLAAPHTIFMALGLITYNMFPDPVKLKKHPKDIPLICMRIVTRGLFPDLVKGVIDKNLSALEKVGVENFSIEVVTNLKIGVSGKNVREILVPSSYSTKMGTLNKARNLQYCLEGNSTVDDDSWIVHLDEETLLTEDSVRGILNFVSEGSCDFGQGTVTWLEEETCLASCWENFQHHICKIANGLRVTKDMGQIRGQFNLFHKPLFSWKGTYIVARVRAEKEVSFDHGPEASLGEDLFFGMMAMEKGCYKFGFIEGEAREMSPFTFGDFIRQRKRWIQGGIRMVASTRISWKNKFIFAISLATWLILPISIGQLLFLWIFPFNSYPVADFFTHIIGALYTFYYIYGYLKQFPIERYFMVHMVIALPELILGSVFGVVLESLAAGLTWLDWWGSDEFFITKKERALGNKTD